MMSAKLLYLVLGVSSLAACWEPTRNSRCLPRDIRNKTVEVPRDYKYWGKDRLESQNRTLVSLAEALGWTTQEPWMELLVEAAEKWNNHSPEVAKAFRNVSEAHIEKWLAGSLSRTIRRNERCIFPMNVEEKRDLQDMAFFSAPLSLPYTYSQWDSPDDVFADCYRPKFRKDNDVYWPLYELGPLTMARVEGMLNSSTGAQHDFWTSLAKVMGGNWKCPAEYTCGDFAPGSAWVPERDTSMRINQYHILRAKLLDALATRSSICFVSNWKRTSLSERVYYIDISTPMSDDEHAAKLAEEEAKRNAANEEVTRRLQEEEDAQLRAWLEKLRRAQEASKNATATNEATAAGTSVVSTEAADVSTEAADVSADVPAAASN